MSQIRLLLLTTTEPNRNIHILHHGRDHSAYVRPTSEFINILRGFHDRTLIITATQGAGYTAPCVVDEKRALCYNTDFEQEVARYADQQYRLGLFPHRLDGRCPEMGQPAK